MATAAGPATATPRTLEPERRFVIRDVDWEGYEALLRVVAGGQARVTFDGRDAELMSPSYDHDNYKTRVARLIETLALELNIECDGLGSMTWRRRLEEKGLEADECYYLSTPEPAVGERDIDLTVDPPPDLAIEIEISRSALDRMGIYAALRVPEVWRFDGEALVIERLQADGAYAAVAASPFFPFLPPGEVVRWLERGVGMRQTPWLREFREWVRAELLPGYGGR